MGATFQGIRTGAGSELKSFAEEKKWLPSHIRTDSPAVF